VKSYYELKRQDYRREEVIPRIEDWWANGNVICNEKVRPGQDKRLDQVWGDHFNLQLRDMLEEACRTRDIPDCEIFINKRDYPHLKVRRGENIMGEGGGNLPFLTLSTVCDQ